MKCALVLLLAVGASATVTTPVSKVITLLNGMLEKGKTEKAAEQVQYAAFAAFCEKNAGLKKNSIKGENQAISMDTADIGKFSADDSLLQKEIKGLDKDADTFEAEKIAAADARKTQAADYQTTHKEYGEALDAIERAIAVLKKQVYDRKQAAAGTGDSLAQVAALKDFTLIPADAKKKIDAFLQGELEVDAEEIPEANAYEFQSHGVVQMLEKLMNKFADERTTLEKEEANSKHSSAMLAMDLTAQISQAKEDRGDKAQADAKAKQMGAMAKGDLQDVQMQKAEDAKFLSDLNTECRTKASDFEARQGLRSTEIEGIEKAVEVLGSNAVAGNAAKHLPALMQMPKISGRNTAFAMLRANTISLAQEKATFYLSEQAKHLNSRVLSTVAARAKADGFDKVKKMIKDLIVRLMESANEEAEHKGWCDTELATNEQTRKEKTEATEMLNADLDELKASISQIVMDVAGLSKVVAELDSAMATTTTIRQEEKATNKATIQDSQDAQTALAQALVVMKEFYAQTAGFVQEKAVSVSSQAPDFASGKYQAMAETQGVVGMLEVIESDFGRLEAETSAGEATSQKAYETFMTETKENKAAKVSASEHKAAKKQNQEQSLTQKTTDLADTQKVLDAALSYYDKLKPSCIDSGTSFEDRAARRKEEVESLQEALKILNGEDIA